MLQLDRFWDFFEGLPLHAEVRFAFDGSKAGREYMIVKYEDRVSFQRCGFPGGSGEREYGSLETLLDAVTVDGICLERDWKEVVQVEVDGHIRLSSSGRLSVGERRGEREEEA